MFETPVTKGADEQGDGHSATVRPAAVGRWLSVGVAVYKGQRRRLVRHGLGPGVQHQSSEKSQGAFWK